MEFVALCPPYDLCNPYRSMEAIGPQRNSPSLAQGVLQSLLPSALDKGILFKGDVYTAEPDPTLHERTSSKSEATGPASPPFREESCDEAVYRYLVQEYISPDTLDSDEAITHPPYSRGYDDGPCCGESDHHRSREGSPLRSTQHNGADDARMAPIQDFGCPLSASGNNTLGAGGPQFQTVYPPATQQPSDPSDILKLLERHGIGRATCLWMHDGIRCGYSSQIDLVKRHIKRVHFRLRPCVCEYCGRSFFNNYALSLHHNSHTGAKPFICNFCGRGFSSPSGKSHHRVHMHGYRVRKRSAIPADDCMMIM